MGFFILLCFIFVIPGEPRICGVREGGPGLVRKNLKYNKIFRQKEI